MKKDFLGFTLTNLLITLALSALLAATGIPKFATLLYNSQANNAYRQLFTLIQFTRIQAVNYQSQAILCPTINQTECVINWREPLMIFIDSNNDETRNEDEQLLKITQRMLKEESIHWQASGSLRYLRFKAEGATRNQNGRLTYCLKKEKKIYARQIIMYKTGRARKGRDIDAQEKCSA